MAMMKRNMMVVSVSVEVRVLKNGCSDTDGLIVMLGCGERRWRVGNE